MKSDRELLELAARASGLLLCGYSWIGENEGDDECEILESAFVKRHPEQELASKWNPLTDDGDAFRLMVALRLWRDDPDICCVERVEDHNGDELSATRRAIVRAAAALWERMQ